MTVPMLKLVDAPKMAICLGLTKRYRGDSKIESNMSDPVLDVEEWMQITPSNFGPHSDYWGSWSSP